MTALSDKIKYCGLQILITKFELKKNIAFLNL